METLRAILADCANFTENFINLKRVCYKYRKIKILPISIIHGLIHVGKKEFMLTPQKLFDQTTIFSQTLTCFLLRLFHDHLECGQYV